MVIDYSKWDNIDTDSDDEPVRSAPQPAKATEPQAGQKNPAPPSQASTPAPDKPPDDASAGKEKIKAVIVRCDGDTTGPKWSATTIPSDHPIFEQQRKNEAPLPALLGIPLIFRRLPSSQFNTRASGLDNQIVTYLNIELESGFAPAAWQSQVGTVLVARQDKKPLLEQHLEGVWMYCDYILGLFGDGAGPPRHLYSRPAFEKWWARYAEETRGYRDDWNNVPLPY
ncbi:putative ectomycorrhiza-upregulated zf-mynd domain-containing protein [Diaporthe ampelina]|uniref:Putative ectomycorrhiza-upregulated zf-mynd domain-containing protein n=1 Tax=Diaporthe ampelina TaxID=1214573 RepID=A0A0G2F6U1_9PEZI|nr:putative ectomycorrhiza-upregulated zf-mynd domain-containing protein [Diaporthe ampelina]